MTELLSTTPSASGLDRLADLPVRLTVVLGKARVPIATLAAAEAGTILELDTKAGDPVDILINDRLVGRGEIVTIGDRLGVTFTELRDRSE